MTKQEKIQVLERALDSLIHYEPGVSSKFICISVGRAMEFLFPEKFSGLFLSHTEKIEKYFLELKEWIVKKGKELNPEYEWESAWFKRVGQHSITLDRKERIPYLKEFIKEFKKT